MLNEERIKLMTRMASFESKEGKKDVPIASYFRSDYLGWQVLKAVICATIAYMIVFGVYIYYNLESLLVNVFKMDLFAFAKEVLKYYVIVTVIYAVIVFFVSLVKYNMSRKNLKKYFNNLKLLNSMYAKEKALAERADSEV